MYTSAPISINAYPLYFNTGDVLLAFTGPDKMYKVEAIGNNKNMGVTIDYYITRKMVLKHWRSACDSHAVSRDKFLSLMEKLYKAYFDKM